MQKRTFYAREAYTPLGLFSVRNHRDHRTPVDSCVNPRDPRAETFPRRDSTHVFLSGQHPRAGRPLETFSSARFPPPSSTTPGRVFRPDWPATPGYRVRCTGSLGDSFFASVLVHRRSPGTRARVLTRTRITSVWQKPL